MIAVSNLYDKLAIDKQMQVLGMSPNQSGKRVIKILTSTYFVEELTIGEADSIYRFFLGGTLDLDKLYKIFYER